MVQVLDQHNNEQTWEWMVAKFGPVQHKVQPVADAFRLVRLREVEGPASVVVTVLDKAGRPQRDEVVCWSWPDAPRRPGAGWDEKAEMGRTDGNGVVGFGMGRGAYYSPPNRGPHAVWLYGTDKSDYVGGLGMLAGTNHVHLEPTFQWVEAGGEPEPDPSPLEDARWATLFLKLDHIIGLLEAHVEDDAG